MRRRAKWGAVGLALLGLASPAWSQAAPEPRPLSLEQALRMAEAESEQVLSARAGVLRAQGQQVQARSAWFPQVNASLSYTRTLASEFQGATGEPADSAAPRPQGCGAFTPDPALPLEQRVDSLERAVRCASEADPLAALSGLFRNLPFGRENQYRLGFDLTQSLFTGGRILAQNRIARAGRTAAELALEQSRAQLALDVTQAYYDAVLAGRLLAIAEATTSQAETTLRQAQLAHRVGNQPEFEVLRAQVTLDNQRPVVIQRRAERDLALLRLKQLLNLAADQPLQLTTDLGEGELAPVTRLAAEVTGLPEVAPDAAGLRSVVRQAEESVRVQESLVDVAQAQRLPALYLQSQYGRVAYPETGLPAWDQSRANWTVSLGLQVPLFSGGRIRGEEMVARANLMEAQVRLRQVREVAALDARAAREQLNAAEAAWRASQGTVEQAARAYTIAEVRYREGISTQVELSDSRILLQQAEANRAVAARNLQVARARAALLPYLPLGAGTAAGGQQGTTVPAQPSAAQQAPRQQAASTSFTGTPGAGTQ